MGLPELVKEGEEVAARINEKLRELITTDLVELEQIRELMGKGGEPARLLIHQIIAYPGRLQIEEQLRAENWTMQNRIQIVIRSYTPPGTRR